MAVLKYLLRYISLCMPITSKVGLGFFVLFFVFLIVCFLVGWLVLFCFFGKSGNLCFLKFKNNSNKNPLGSSCRAKGVLSQRNPC